MHTSKKFRFSVGILLEHPSQWAFVYVSGFVCSSFSIKVILELVRQETSFMKGIEYWAADTVLTVSKWGYRNYFEKLNI